MRLRLGQRFEMEVMCQDFGGLAESGLCSVALSYLEIFLL
jgi:hypothetical protein